MEGATLMLPPQAATDNSQAACILCGYLRLQYGFEYDAFLEPPTNKNIECSPLNIPLILSEERSILFSWLYMKNEILSWLYMKKGKHIAAIGEHV